MRTRTRHRWLARTFSRGLDLVLFLPALVYVLSEHVLWAGARTLLHGLGRLAAVKAAQAWLGLLPPFAALPVFLVPEVFSHLSELWAAVLLARGHLLAASLAASLGKGAATVILVWIYQACEPALLRIPWFARAHHAFLKGRARGLARTRPLRDAALARLRLTGVGPGAVARRFRRWRVRLAPHMAWVRARW